MIVEELYPRSSMEVKGYSREPQYPVRAEKNPIWVGKKKLKSEVIECSDDTLKDWRLSGKLIEGVHWTKLGPQKNLYNQPLIEDFLANQHDPAAHQRAIDLYLASLQSNQRRAVGRPRN